VGISTVIIDINDYLLSFETFKYIKKGLAEFFSKYKLLEHDKFSKRVN
jgi:hypothetical protein